MTAGEKLMKLRVVLGLSLRQVAEQINVSIYTLSKFEHDLDASFTKDTRQKISAFIEEHEHEIPDDKETWIARAVQKAKEDEALRKQMRRTFIEGKRYSVFNTEKGGNNVYDINPVTGRGCIFIYIRKSGRHHMFREERGNWIRTYTDVQLIGKKIKEVK